MLSVTNKDINTNTHYTLSSQTLCNLTKKIILLAAAILFGAVIGAVTAAAFGLNSFNMMVLAGVGALISIPVYLGFVILCSCRCRPKKESTQNMSITFPSKPAVKNVVKAVEVQPKIIIPQNNQPLADILKTHTSSDKGIKKTFTDKELDQISDKIDDMLREIQASAEKDLPLEEHAIEQKYHLEKALAPLSETQKIERRKRLQIILAKAYVNRELKQKGNLARGSVAEGHFLKCLGYHIDKNSPYYDTDLVYGMLKEVVQEELKADKFSGSLEFVRQSLNKCALRARLSNLGITAEDEVEKFQSGFEFYKSFRKTLFQELEASKFDIPTDFPLQSSSSPAIKLIQEMYDRHKSRFLRSYVENFFKNVNASYALMNPTIDAVKFKKNLEKEQKNLNIESTLKNQLKQEKIPNSIEKSVLFYKNWGKYLKAEMIQGLENEDEVLGKGVCNAVCQRIEMVGQKNPAITPEEMAKHIEIRQIDRFRQGVHHMAIDLPKELLLKEGFKKDELLFHFFYNPEDGIKYEDLKTKELENSSGWTHIGLAFQGENTGHAIMMRLDPQQGRAWLFDPNVGLLCFEEDKKSYQNAKNDCLACFKALMEYNYPTTYFVYGKQLVKN